MSERCATRPLYGWALFAVGAVCAACTGRVAGQPDGDTFPDQNARGGASQVAGAGAGGGNGATLLATSPLRRFTSFEYDNAVRELLGTALGPGEAFMPQQRDGTFDNDVSNLTVSAPLVEQYLQAAELLAAEATSDANLRRVFGCELAQLTEACALQALPAFGKRAYRRPLSDAELADLATTFQEGQVAGGIKTGLEFALGRILISPSFLYWVELGVPDTAPRPGGRVALTQFEVASRISRLLLGSIPDPALLEAAERGALQAVSERQAQAKRLLRAADGEPTEGASSNLAQFHAGWLGLSGLETMSKGLPTWSRELAASMRAETETFLADLVWSRADSSDMFRVHHSYVDARLAPLYGVAQLGSELVRTDLDPRARSGLLTQASFMAKSCRKALRVAASVNASNT